MEELEYIAAAVQFLMRSFVIHPDQLTLSVHEKEDGSVRFQVGLSPDDFGRIIGKEGRVARAFRIILHSISGSLQRRIELNIGDKG